MKAGYLTRHIHQAISSGSGQEEAFDLLLYDLRMQHVGYLTSGSMQGGVIGCQDCGLGALSQNVSECRDYFSGSARGLEWNEGRGREAL